MSDSPSLLSLAGASALVTGAAGGIGAAVLEALVGAGARVACAADHCVALAAGRLGGLQVLVNCLGALVPNQVAHGAEAAEWERALAINATAVSVVC